MELAGLVDGLVKPSQPVLVVAVITVTALAAAALSALLRPPPREERYTRYLSYFQRRQAEWCSQDERTESRPQRLFKEVMRRHILLRLFRSAEWNPLPPPSRLRTIAMLLAIVQATGLVAVLFFVPPIRFALSGFIGSTHLLPILAATFACVAVQLCLRVALDFVFRARSTVLFQRPDLMGRTEGHVLARAALANFDHSHTMHRMLWLWRQNIIDMEQLGALLARLRYQRTMDTWRQACAIIEERNAAERLRAQKLHAWALVGPDWLGEFAGRLGARLMPLGRQLKFAMPLDELLLDSLAVSTHEHLEPSASERMLEYPAVAHAKLLLGGRWALREWKEVIASMTRDLNRRRSERGSLLARRTAAAARRAAAVLGCHAGFYMWKEACAMMDAQAQARSRIAQSMASFGLGAAQNPLMAGLGYAGCGSGGDAERDDDASGSDDGSEPDDENAEEGGASAPGMPLELDDSLAAVGANRRKGLGPSSRYGIDGGNRVLAASSPAAKAHYARRHGLEGTDGVEGGGKAAEDRWEGVPALQPESLLRDARRMEEVHVRAMAAHPPPLARVATTRVLRSSLPYPVGVALASVDRVRCVQSGVPPPIFVSK